VRTYSNTGDYGSTSEIRDALGNGYYLSYWVDSNPTDLYDPNGHHTSFEYDSRGNLIKVTSPHPDPNILTGFVETNYAYDVKDNLISKKDSLNNTWIYTYDDRNHLTKIKSPLGNETTMTYDSKGQLTQITDANGKIITFTYDSFGNVKTMTDALGNTTMMSYDSTSINRTSITDARGNTTQLVYDKNDRLTKVTYPDGTSKTFTYDCCADNSMTDENGNTTAFTRDPMLHITQVTNPLGEVTQQEFDKNGNLVSITDPLAHTMTKNYDAANRLLSITNPKGHTVQMGYDPNGNLISLKDERGKQTTFTYDYNNLPLSTTDPLGHGVDRIRDALGRVITGTNARGGKIDFTYDADGRITKKTYNGVTAASYGYDAVGNLITVTDSTGTTTYTYNARKEVTGIGYPDGKTLSLIYDPVGNISSITYPGGLVVSYTYDNRNRVAGITWDGNSMTYSYDGVGNVTKEVRSNGTESAYVYDANGDITQIQHKKGSNSFGQMTYTRDATGNTTQETKTLPISSVITTQSISTTYNNANQIIKWGSDSYTYDNDGNVTSITGTESFSAMYDHEDRPISITRNGVTTTYIYDGIGIRTKAVTGTQTHNYHYDPIGKLVFETDTIGQIIAYYIYSGVRLSAMKYSSVSYFYHFDNTGNTIALTDGSGNINLAYAYEPFGRVSNKSSSIPNPFTYVGAYGVMDEGGGLYFMKNRYYDGKTGRFIQRDPIGFVGGNNLYTYVENQPVDFIDPIGLEEVSPKIKAVTAGANLAIGGTLIVTSGFLFLGGVSVGAGAPVIAPLTAALLMMKGFAHYFAGLQSIYREHKGYSTKEATIDLLEPRINFVGSVINWMSSWMSSKGSTGSSNRSKCFIPAYEKWK
jgi:RHS repeat-associated protein